MNLFKFGLVTLLFGVNSNVWAASKMLSFMVSTLLVSNFFHNMPGPQSQESFQNVKVLIMRDITCRLSTPTYFYELGGCEAEIKGAKVSLNEQMSAAILSSLPVDIEGDAAAGSIFYSIDSIRCLGMSRGSTCVLYYNR